MLLVDTNVLVDILENDPEWADWSIAQLRAQSKVHRLAINPVIYAELSLTILDHRVQLLCRRQEVFCLGRTGFDHAAVFRSIAPGVVAVERDPQLLRSTDSYAQRLEHTARWPRPASGR